LDHPKGAGFQEKGASSRRECLGRTTTMKAEMFKNENYTNLAHTQRSPVGLKEAPGRPGVFFWGHNALAGSLIFLQGEGKSWGIGGGKRRRCAYGENSLLGRSPPEKTKIRPGLPPARPVGACPGKRGPAKRGGGPLSRGNRGGKKICCKRGRPSPPL